MPARRRAVGYRSEKLGPEPFEQLGQVPTGGWGRSSASNLLHPASLIKSGGEWISSIDLENTASDHPKIKEAAVIGVPHPKWDERPLLIVVLDEGQTLSEKEILAWFDGKVASWWVPDTVRIVDSLPHTATGKLDKKVLRAEFSA